LGALIAIAVAVELPAQADVAARLSGRVSAEVAAAVGQLAESAARQGLPVEPLVEKAIEGGAKGVPAARVIGALRSLVGVLGESATAVRAAGMAGSNAEVIEAGAFALNAGLDRREVESLVRHSRPPYLPAATLRVAGTLAALGVPAGETADVVQQAIDAGTSPGDLLDLPQQVEMGVAHGASPGAAAAGLGRGQASAPGLTRPHGSQGQGKGQSHKP
jgi:hypothetical protein